MEEQHTDRDGHDDAGNARSREQGGPGSGLDEPAAAQCDQRQHRQQAEQCLGIEDRKDRGGGTKEETAGEEPPGGVIAAEPRSRHDGRSDGAEARNDRAGEHGGEERGALHQPDEQGIEREEGPVGRRAPVTGRRRVARLDDAGVPGAVEGAHARDELTGIGIAGCCDVGHEAQGKAGEGEEGDLNGHGQAGRKRPHATRCDVGLVAQGGASGLEDQNARCLAASLVSAPSPRQGKTRVSGGGLQSGFRPASISARRPSRKGGSARRSPSVSSGSSAVKPGPSVAISNSTPLGSRK